MRDQLVTETSTDVTVWFYYCDIHVLIDSSSTTYCILPSSVRCEVVTENMPKSMCVCACMRVHTRCVHVYVCLHLCALLQFFNPSRQILG